MEKVPKKKCFYEEPEQVCQPKYGKECKDIPDKKCKITYDEKCVDVPEEVCKPVSQKKCSKKPVQVFTNSIKFLLNFTSFSLPASSNVKCSTWRNVRQKRSVTNDTR